MGPLLAATLRALFGQHPPGGLSSIRHAVVRSRIAVRRDGRREVVPEPAVGEIVAAAACLGGFAIVAASVFLWIATAAGLL